MRIVSHARWNLETTDTVLDVLRQLYPGNQVRTKHVESLLVPCLDAGSNPASSTKGVRFVEEEGKGLRAVGR